MSIARSIAAFWDAAADSFDEHPDHGLHDPRIRAAWSERLDSWLPDRPADVLDLGCGTGSLSALMAHRGHRVTGVDISPNMVERARHKLVAAGHSARVLVGDAADPPPLGHSVDVILARHLLWTLSDPTAALRRWIALSRPGGRLVLIEGRWNTEAGDDYVEGSPLPWTGGVTAQVLAETLNPLVTEIQVEPLNDPNLWGRPITDERYAIIAII